MARDDLTAQRLRELLHYDPETGVFTWRHHRGNRLPGMLAGHMRSDGYISIRIDNAHRRANRLAWLYMCGKWPNALIDHVNRNLSDNRWINLREATHSQTHQNQKMRKDNTHGFQGIELHSSGLWRARLVIQGKRYRLGYFKTPEEAYAARLEGEKRYFTHSPVCGLPYENLASLFQSDDR